MRKIIILVLYLFRFAPINKINTYGQLIHTNTTNFIALDDDQRLGFFVNLIHIRHGRWLFAADTR